MPQLSKAKHGRFLVRPAARVAPALVLAHARARNRARAGPQVQKMMQYTTGAPLQAIVREFNTHALRMGTHNVAAVRGGRGSRRRRAVRG